MSAAKAAPKASPASRSFDKRLYAIAAIQDALEAYAELAELTVDKGEEAWTVHVTSTDDDFTSETLASELANYVLVGTIERKR